MNHRDKASNGTAATKRFIITLFGVVTCLSLFGCFADEIKGIVIDKIDFASIKDGVYEGAQYNKPITAKVQVRVKDGKVDSIKVLEHMHGPGKGAEAIIDRIITAQSLGVDAVSGATLSSKVMLKAIDAALEKGL